jgi:hypothetical protein
MSHNQDFKNPTDYQRETEPSASTSSTTMRALLGVLVLLGLISGYHVANAIDQTVQSELTTIDDRAADEVIQYGYAMRSGTRLDACKQAGVVGAAYLDARNETAYKRWKQIEAENCK